MQVLWYAKGDFELVTVFLSYLARSALLYQLSILQDDEGVRKELCFFNELGGHKNRCLGPVKCAARDVAPDSCAR